MVEAIALATALVVLVAAIITPVVTWRTKQRVREIHVLVNSRMSDMEKRVRQLTQTLDEAGIPVPLSWEREEQEDASS